MAILPYLTPPTVGSDDALDITHWNNYIRQNMETMRQVQQAKTLIGYAVTGDGGASVASTWTTRPLSYIRGNTSSQVELHGNNEFTIQPGTWNLSAICNIGGAGNVFLRLWDVNASVVIAQGMVTAAGTSVTSPAKAHLKFLNTYGVATRLRLDQWSTNSIGNGMGPGIAGVTTHHTYIELDMIKEP